MQIPVKIIDIRQETPTTKSLRLDLGGQEFRFLPGQWMDCYAEIDGDIGIAGYSMTSSPTNADTIDLAVKLVGENPVTHYVHDQARVGDVLHIEVGGDFYYKRDMGDSLTLIAGGIGITPLMSIVRYVNDAAPEVRLTLVYSAKAPSELLFHDDLNEISSKNENIHCLFTVTQPTSEPWDGRVSRIDADMLEKADIDLNALFFICGPPSMVADTVLMVEGFGVLTSRIKYERW